MSTDPYDRVREMIVKVVPGRSDEWYDLYLQRTRQYLEKNGDMTGAPALPEDR